jgi:hypothetical protein
MSYPPRPPDPDDEVDRTRTNLILLALFGAIVGIGIWLANAMIDQRQIDDCAAQGRRNCNVIDVPPR